MNKRNERTKDSSKHTNILNKSVKKINLKKGVDRSDLNLYLLSITLDCLLIEKNDQSFATCNIIYYCYYYYLLCK